MIELQPDLQLTRAEAERLLGAWLGEPVVCSGIKRLEGGLVNTTLRLDFDRHPLRAVVKLHRSSDAFTREARALGYLHSQTTCPVPAVHLRGKAGHIIPYSFLLLELVPGRCLKDLDLEPEERADIERQLAAVLSELHDHRGSGWGPLDDATQSATWADVVVSRLVEARSHPKVTELLSPDVLAAVDAAIDLARHALDDSGGPALIHGDVWDGNMMVRLDDGRWRISGLIDPDLQFADPEFELAYLEVFDNSRRTFFDAYTDRHALRPGYERRRLFYWLHTALVHVGLFGDDYFRRFTARTANQILDTGRQP